MADMVLLGAVLNWTSDARGSSCTVLTVLANSFLSVMALMFDVSNKTIIAFNPIR